MSGLFVAFNAKQEFKMWHFQSLATVCLLLAVLLLQGKVLFSCYHLFSVHSFHRLKMAKNAQVRCASQLGCQLGTDKKWELPSVIFCHYRFVLSSVIKKVRD